MRRLTALALFAALPAPAAELSFNRDIRPILSDHCYACHGFDKSSRKADLRLDNLAGATAVLDGVRAIVPGDPAASEAVKRMLSTDPEEMMPPPKAKKPIKPADVAILKQWIAQGAKYEGHWAFTPPVRPPVPTAATPGGINPIDAFIRARLEKEGLKPAAPADKVTLLRRVTYDLTGLPPTPAEIDAFLADEAPTAYEKVVDRLLQSPRYGEKMAVNWLDLARYADTHGYHLDSGRVMWPWRDWVIDTFNRNQPFDQFVRWQIAGDLLPEQLPQQRLATGFIRNNMINFEGGAIADEYLHAYMVDRVNTFGTVFLGLSVNCTQCHDHKYDPLTTREFYQLYAYFNATPEKGLDGNKGNAAPVMSVATPDFQKKLDELKRAVASAEEAVAASRRATAGRQAEWEKTFSAQPIEWAVVPPTEAKTESGAQFVAQGDGSLLASGPNPGADDYLFTIKLPKPGVTALRLEALTHETLFGKGPGRAANGNFVLTDVRVEDAATGRQIKIASATADYAQKDFPAAALVDGDAKSGWAVDGNERHETRTAWLTFAQPVNAASVRVKLGFHSGFAGHSIGRTRLAVTTDAHPLPARAVPAAVTDALKIPEPKRTPAQRQAVTEFFLEDHATAASPLTAALEAARKNLAEAEKSEPTVMVMEQSKQPRETHIHIRGDYATLGDKVEPGVPAILGALPTDAPKDRRALAAWLTDRKHPLLARVTVNRLWRNIFGVGIVKTVNDFGLQGEWPSHPELLDWLAVEFMDQGWDVKGLLRLMVTSAAYRQSASVRGAGAESLARDPENRLLARGPRFRLSAEEIRDTALATSGLLNPQIGGPSVYPYQPAGLWEELSSRGDSKNWTAQFFEQSHGADLYRRSLYTFIKRTCPPPQMQTFDAPDRETCTAQRERTNTPLQALVTLNDPTYVEASRILAEKMLTQGGATPEQQVKYAFRLATARVPSEREVGLLTELFQRQRAHFAADPRKAAELLTTGEAPRNQQLSAPDLAAWTVVASTILNLDETLTRG